MHPSAIDSKTVGTYPDASPILANGEVTHKYKIIRMLNQYLGMYKNELLNSHTSKNVGYGLYYPYSCLASWNIEPSVWKNMGLNPVRCGHNGLDHFQFNMRMRNEDYSLFDLETSSLDDLLKIPFLVLVGGFFMSQPVQKKLVSYVLSGGSLLIAQDIPYMDETFTPCTFLKKTLIDNSKKYDVLSLGTKNKIIEAHCYRKNQGKLIHIQDNLFTDDGEDAFHQLIETLGLKREIITNSKNTQVWIRKYNDISHVFVLSMSEDSANHTVRIKFYDKHYDEIVLKFDLPAKSGSIFRLSGNQITSCLVKGINEEKSMSGTINIKCNKKDFCNHAVSDFIYPSI